MSVFKKSALWLATLGLALTPSLQAVATPQTLDQVTESRHSTPSLEGVTSVTAVEDAQEDIAVHPAEPGDIAVLAEPQASTRWAGTNRYETAVAISQDIYPAGANTVYIASGRDFPDALAGGPAAAHRDAPVLLVNTTVVPKVVRDELARLAPDEIIVLGGPSVVSGGVVNVLKAYAPVTRVAGGNRYETAALTAGMWTSASTVYLASGTAYPDALAGGAAAAYQGVPILLSRGDQLPQATEARLKQLAPARVVLLGGTMALSSAVEQRVKAALPGVTLVRYAGTNRYDTARVVATQTWPQGSSVAFYATGADFADALAGVPAAAQYEAPLLLVRSECAPAATRLATEALGVDDEVILGGPASVAEGATRAGCGAPPATDTVLAALDALEVKGRAPRTGYSRDEFGPAWTDAVDVQGGRNGCDTRNDVLRRDLTGKTLRPNTNGCVVETGWLNEPFSGEQWWFERGVTSSTIHIDHLVALSDAWQKGAQQMTFEDRKNFANDPLNLWAVSGPLNNAKGDGDAATWLPPNKSIRCDYVSYQVAVKKEYNLWMTQAEQDAIRSIITTSCPGKKLPTANDVPPLGQ